MVYKSVKDFKIGDVIKCKNGDLLKILDINQDFYNITKIDAITQNSDGNNENNEFNLNVDRDYLLIILNLGFKEAVEENSVLTHNCMQRLVCGQLGAIASRMALDNMQATTIDGKHKGAGMTKSQGVINNVQYYFTEQTWIESWYAKRGLTDKGFEPGEDPNEQIDPSTINLGDDEEIMIDKKVTRIEFNKEVREIDNTKSQKFEEV